MMNNIILEKLKESEKFRLIFSKNRVLEEAIWALQGSTTDACDYFYVFENIERNYDLNELLSKELRLRNYEITSTEDMRVPAGDELEWICQQIRRIDSGIEEFKGIWEEQIQLNIYVDSGFWSFEEINKTLRVWMDYFYLHHERLFNEIIERFRAREKSKLPLIDNLQKELTPFQETAQKLIEIEEIEKNWGSELGRIIDTDIYCNSFYEDFVKEKESILERHSIHLNEQEKIKLDDFHQLLRFELNIV